MIPPELSPLLCPPPGPGSGSEMKLHFTLGLRSGQTAAQLPSYLQSRVGINIATQQQVPTNNIFSLISTMEISSASNRRQIIQISNRNFRIICPTYIIQISILQSRNTNEARRVNHLSLFQYSSICWQNIVSMIFLKDVMIV